MTTQSLSFRPSSFTISIVSNMFDSVDFHTKQLNDLCKLFYLLVVGAGSDGSGLLLYLGSVRHDWSPMKRNLYEMSQRATRILPLHGWGCNQRRRNRGKANDRHQHQQRSQGEAGRKHMITTACRDRMTCQDCCTSFYRFGCRKLRFGPRSDKPTFDIAQHCLMTVRGHKSSAQTKAAMTMTSRSVRRLNWDGIFMVKFYSSDGSVWRRDFRRRTIGKRPSIATTDGGQKTANRTEDSDQMGAREFAPG